jgi:hypothetical protein
MTLAMSIALALHAALCFPSCGFVEPEPYKNQSAHAPALPVQPGTVSNYSDLQAVAGTIAPNFLPTRESSAIAMVAFWIDSTFVTDAFHPPYTFTINTTAWPEGMHTLTFGVYLKGDSLGLLQLLSGPPTQMSAMRLIFDQTPPTPPSGVVATVENGYARISWTPVVDRNFHHYDLLRKLYLDSWGGLTESDFTIPARTTGTILDTTEILEIPYPNLIYLVGSSNNVSTAYSTPVSIRSGVVSLGLQGMPGAILEGDSLVILMSSNFPSMSPRNLASLSTQTGLVKSTRSSSGRGPVVLSVDRRIVYDSFIPAYQLFDANKLEGLGYVPANQLFDNFAVGSDGKLYLSLAAELFVYDPTTYSVIHSIQAFTGSARLLSMSPAGDALIAVDGNGIKRFEVAGDSAGQVNQVVKPIGDPASQLYVDWADSKLYYTGVNTTVLELWDLKSLTLLATLPTHPASVNAWEIADVKASDRYLYVAFPLGTPTASYNALLVEYDKSTMVQHRSWYFIRQASDTIMRIGVTRKGRYLFMCIGSNQWGIDLGMQQ